MGTSYDYLFKLLIIGNRESNKQNMLEMFLSQTNNASATGDFTPPSGITYGSVSGKYRSAFQVIMKGYC